MTLQERLLASAKELVRLLEESQKEHNEMIRERDRKLLCFQVDNGREYKSLAKEVEQREHKEFMHTLDMDPSKSGKLKPHKPVPIHIAVDHKYTVKRSQIRGKEQIDEKL